MIILKRLAKLINIFDFLILLINKTKIDTMYLCDVKVKLEWRNFSCMISELERCEQRY
jgi:hypothetical protein